MNEPVGSELKLFDFKLKTLIIGLGISGYSCVEFLASKNCPFDVLDTRERPPNCEAMKQYYPRVRMLHQNIDEALLSQYEQVVVSPGISIRQTCFEDFTTKGKLVTGDVELFAQELNVRNAEGSCTSQVIAITGSNGKSTVTTMVEHILKRVGISVIAGGNLGLPALSMLKHAVDVYVLELSSFQLETLESLNCSSAVLLNISEDHMDRYDDLNDYQGVKEKIYQNCKAIVLNGDEQYAAKIGERYSSTRPIIRFSVQSKTNTQYGLGRERENSLVFFNQEIEQEILPIGQLRVKGKHNVSNALAAIALLAPWKLNLNDVANALKNYVGLPNRCEWIRELKGVNFYNDSKGTNVGATIAAIDGFSEEVCLIAGGIGKDADFAPLAKVVCEKVKSVVLFGQDARMIENAIKSDVQFSIKKPVIYKADILEEAVQIAFENTSPRMSVLFSPACASFDQYPNYMARGEDFVKQVKKLSID